MKLLKKLPNLLQLFSLFLVIASAGPGVAQKQPQIVQVRIGTILASNQNDEFDVKLKSLESQLRVLKYRSYRLLKDESQNVPWKGTNIFEIPGGRFLMVAPQEFQDNRITTNPVPRRILQPVESSEFSHTHRGTVQHRRNAQR